MKNKLLKYAVCLLLSFVLAFEGISVSAEGGSFTVGDAEGLVCGILDLKLKEYEAADIQEWIDGALSDNAGVSSEWYILALSQRENYDFTAYGKALEKYISENEIRSAATRLKYGLLLIPSGGSDEEITEILGDSIGEQGVMSWVYGLHIMNNDYTPSGLTCDEVVDKLLSLRTADGGWAVRGDTGDVDVTAMTVQALAPYCDSDEKVKKAIDDAVALLSSRQLQDGSFSGYGVPNSESTAQVITALSSLNIDPIEDERFIKNGNTVFDGLKLFLKENGGFSHGYEEEYSDMATVQALTALISYIRMKEGKTPFYILDTYASFTENAAEEPQQELPEAEASEEENAVSEEPVSYKLWASIGIAAVALIVIAILLVTGRRSIKNIIAVAVISAGAVLFVIFTEFSTPAQYYGESTLKENPVGTVTLSLRCDTVAGKSEAEYIPSDGIILEDSFRIEEGESVFDILIEAVKKHSIQLEYSGSSDMPYISGINYIYEFDFGDLSGWMYFVNGESPSVNCADYRLSDGDRIEWLYTCEMGNDLK